MASFTANALPVLIGSLPLKNHTDAVDLIFDYTPEVPLWPQLPGNREEGMLLQFLPGLPGVRQQQDKTYVDCQDAAFEEELLAFFEDYLSITEAGGELEGSRFAMTDREAGGFQAFIRRAKRQQTGLVALKGQLTGPITFCTGLVDQDGRALFYNEQMRDAAVKLLSLKARWQARMMAQIAPQPLIFFDEPGLAGFGSSAFITITPADIAQCFEEVFAGVHIEGGLAGVHVCANTEWPIIFETDVDVVSYDAYSYFDKLILYPQHLKSFFGRGGILASGIVPTTPDHIEQENAARLAEKWFYQTDQLEKLGIPAKTIFSQTLITPSCGTGTTTEAQTARVLQMTREVSQLIRNKYL